VIAPLAADSDDRCGRRPALWDSVLNSIARALRGYEQDRNSTRLLLQWSSAPIRQEFEVQTPISLRPLRRRQGRPPH
jgi:spore coat polysaccharide biosynthesis predicted glycosyltransferase SpsG